VARASACRAETLPPEAAHHLQGRWNFRLKPNSAKSKFSHRLWPIMVCLGPKESSSCSAASGFLRLRAPATVDFAMR